MAIARHNVQGFIALGRLLNSDSGPASDLVVDEERDLAPAFPTPLTQGGGVTRRSTVFRLLGLAGRTVIAERPNIVVTDAILTPRADPQIPSNRPHLTGAWTHDVWSIVTADHSCPEPELEWTAGSRRIWNRELLTPRECRVETCRLLEFDFSGCRREDVVEPPQLDPPQELQPVSDVFPQLGFGSLASESASTTLAILPLDEEGYEDPHLMQPRVHVEFDLQPLSAGL